MLAAAAPAAAQEGTDAAGTAAPAGAPAAPREEAWAAGTGTIEVGLGGGLGRFFNAEVTGFDVDLAFGYFVHDSFEVGVKGTVAYMTAVTPEARTNGTGGTLSADGIGTTRLAQLSAGPAATGAALGEWTGSAALLLRFFPLAFTTLLPEYLAPFVGVDAGGMFGSEVDPFVVGSATVGFNLYLARHVAFSPEVGYGFVYAADDDVRFGNSRWEHIVAADWRLGVFF
jgi:hypothetical protein